jgi:antirestriction protein ArdC
MPETEQATENIAPESSASPKRDFRQEVTNQIIEMLEKGTAPWQTPWEAGTLRLPFNPTTDRTYRGGNALHLMAVGARKGFDDPRWLTYRQAQDNGWQVRKGEKGSQIEFWQFDSGTEPAPGQGDADSTRNADRRENAGPIRRVYTVFNVKQIDGIPNYLPKQRQEWEVAETGESILRNSDARIRHDQRDRAFYNRAGDAIHLPGPDAFKTAADYYGTALHELAHWSGHPTRLNRQTLNESYRFGDPNYAKEELRAELASVFLAAESGVPHNPEQHAAYVGSWIKSLQDDKNEIFRAAKDAHKAADFILGLEKSKPIEKAATQLRTETSEHVADFERGSSTVNIVEKETATEHREPVPVAGRRTGIEKDQDAKIDGEKILDGEVDGRKAPSDRDFEQSLADADRKAKQLLGDKARVSEADTESGKYRGAVLTESDQHIVQKLSPRSVVAHSKHLLPQAVQPGENLVISYSNGVAQLKPNKVRERTQALSR